MLCLKSSKFEIIMSFQFLITQIVYAEESKTSRQIYLPWDRMTNVEACTAQPQNLWWFSQTSDVYQVWAWMLNLCSC